MAELMARHGKAGNRYLEFLKEPSLSVGLYRLPAGGTDTQQPHTEDEVYLVLRGAATITVGGEDRAVKAGDTIFVAAEVEHRFHAIAEDLDLLVFFAPAEYSGSGKQPHAS
jgi:quercetin dioxygenase-like cupin family protein